MICFDQTQLTSLHIFRSLESQWLHALEIVGVVAQNPGHAAAAN